MSDTDRYIMKQRKRLDCMIVLFVRLVNKIEYFQYFNSSILFIHHIYSWYFGAFECFRKSVINALRTVLKTKEVNQII